jgi:hypothetical protein
MTNWREECRDALQVSLLTQGDVERIFRLEYLILTQQYFVEGASPRGSGANRI